MKECLSELTILLMLVSANIHAQINPGRIVGLNLSTMTLKTNGISLDPDTWVSIHLGGIFEIPLTDNLALRPGLLYSAKGSLYTIDTIRYSISPSYIEVPVYAVLSFGSDAIKISLFTGPYLACGIGGNKTESGGGAGSISFGSDENDDMKLFDFGLNFGAGINIKGLMISAQYEMGLANLSSVTADDSEMKNKVIGISLGYLFPGK
jgi:hypothetical protein